MPEKNIGNSIEYKQSTFSTLAVKIITHFNSYICSDNIFFQNKFYCRYSLKIGHCIIQKKKNELHLNCEINVAVKIFISNLQLPQ